MKTENTLENKAKFFAQHIGNQVYIPDGTNQKLTGVFKGNYLSNRAKEWWFSINEEKDLTLLLKYGSLQLNPLSQITDEDLLWCYHKYSEIIGYDYTMDFKGCLSSARNTWLTHNGYNDLQKYILLVDFLRSKGYALPWLDLSIEDLLNYDWIELNLK